MAFLTWNLLPPPDDPGRVRAVVVVDVVAVKLGVVERALDPVVVVVAVKLGVVVIAGLLVPNSSTRRPPDREVESF